MVDVPAETPETIPLVPIVAIAGVLLLQVPPDVALVKAVVLPEHRIAVPLMLLGREFTVTSFVL